MKKPESEIRLFNKPDLEMLQQSDVQRVTFIEQKSKFTARFPFLNDEFVEEWETLTKEARQILPDAHQVAETSMATYNVEAAMEQGRNLFQTVMMYAQLVYGNSGPELKLFGKSMYEKARNNQLKLSELLGLAYEEVSKPAHKEALMAKGLAEAEIALLKTLANDLGSKNLIQETSKKDRTEVTTARIRALNKVWEKMVTVSNCAKLVFQDDYALYSVFLLYEGKSSTENPDPTPPPQG